MKENKINWWLIIGIIIVVAIITALVTMQVTGNVVSVARPTGEVTTCTNNCYNLNCANASIRGRSACKAQCANSCARVDVYTKAEVDAMHEEMYAKLVNHARDIAKEEIMKYHTNFSCIDSDGGLNPLVLGYVYGNDKSSGEIVNISDSCPGANSLWEGYCEDSKVSRAYTSCPDGCSMGVCLNRSNMCEIINTTTKTCSFRGIDYTINAIGCNVVPVKISYNGITESYNMFDAGTSSDPNVVHQATLRNGVKLTLNGAPCAIQHYVFTFDAA